MKRGISQIEIDKKKEEDILIDSYEGRYISIQIYKDTQMDKYIK